MLIACEHLRLAAARVAHDEDGPALALANALIPIVTIIGIQMGYLLGGAVIIEQIFGLPGLGWMILNGIFQRDYPVVQGGILFVAVVFLVLNLLVDVLYAFIDPRIKYS